MPRRIQMVKENVASSSYLQKRFEDAITSANDIMEARCNVTDLLEELLKTFEESLSGNAKEHYAPFQGLLRADVNTLYPDDFVECFAPKGFQFPSKR